jgi:hypothetical protein
MTTEPQSSLTGAAFDLANAGYTPMPDQQDKREAEAIDGDSASLREAAEARSSAAQRSPNIREYLDHTGKTAPASEAISLERASRDYANVTAAERLAADSSTSKDLAARVDALRAEALASDPDAAEFYGFESPADEAEPQRSLPADNEPDSVENAGQHAAGELEAELEKALRHPQVRQAIEQEIGEAEKARQSYIEGLDAATQIAQVSFLSQFPELASIAPDHLPGALELMSRQDPQKFARVQAMVATSEQLFAHQQQESRLEAERARQSFVEFAKSEDALFETLLKGEPKATQQAVTAEIFASAKASGIEPADLMGLFNSEPLMRNAAFQHMMYDAAKYRLAMKARDSAAAKPVPPVQRPGTARSSAEREHADVRALTARLSQSGDIKDAVALYHARKSGRR